VTGVPSEQGNRAQGQDHSRSEREMVPSRACAADGAIATLSLQPHVVKSAFRGCGLTRLWLLLLSCGGRSARRDAEFQRNRARGCHSGREAVLSTVPGSERPGLGQAWRVGAQASIE
jgi:hypothetical protein